MVRHNRPEEIQVFFLLITMPEQREDHRVLEFKSNLEGMFPNWGTDYGETVVDENGDEWGTIILMTAFYVHHKTGKVTNKNPEAY